MLLLMKLCDAFRGVVHDMGVLTLSLLSVDQTLISLAPLSHRLLISVGSSGDEEHDLIGVVTTKLSCTNNASAIVSTANNAFALGLLAGFEAIIRHIKLESPFEYTLRMGGIMSCLSSLQIFPVSGKFFVYSEDEI